MLLYVESTLLSFAIALLRFPSFALHSDFGRSADAHW